MIRYTTPALPLEIEGIDLTQQQDVYVSIVQGGKELRKSGNALTISFDGESTTIVVTLSQEETASFKERLSVAVQVNWINSAGQRDATDIAALDVTRNLLDEVIEYGN